MRSAPDGAALVTVLGTIALYRVPFSWEVADIFCSIELVDHGTSVLGGFVVFL